MTQNLKISIIVLTYKKFDNITANIKSILMQTYENYEVIISDDGSLNFNKSFIESIYKNDKNANKFTIITRNENVGTVRNYNTAVKAADGQIIVPLSQDDIFIDENVLQSIADMFSNPKVNVCLGLRKNIINGHIIPNDAKVVFLKRENGKKLWFRNACGNMYWGAALYYRKSFLLEIGMFDEKYYLIEDYSAAMKIIEKGEIIYIMDIPTIFYGMKGVSKSNSNKKNVNHRFVRDAIHICTENYMYSHSLLNSKICRQYLKYNLDWWKYSGRGNGLLKYNNIILDIIIIISKVTAIITGKEINDCRFAILWKLEMIATRLKHKLCCKNK